MILQDVLPPRHRITAVNWVRNGVVFQARVWKEPTQSRIQSFLSALVESGQMMCSHYCSYGEAGSDGVGGSFIFQIFLRICGLKFCHSFFGFVHKTLLCRDWHKLNSIFSAAHELHLFQVIWECGVNVITVILRQLLCALPRLLMCLWNIWGWLSFDCWDQ